MEFYHPPSLQEALEAIGSVYRALRAWKFYPKGHPTRKTSVRLAHANLLQVLDGNALTLACGRAGFSFPDGEKIKDASHLSSSLSHEFFIRRVQKITFLSDLRLEDLLDLLRILTLQPEAIQAAGGMDTLMAEHGIRTIWINEIDLAAIDAKRKKVEAAGVEPPGLDDLENAAAEAALIPEQNVDDSRRPPEEELQDLLPQLKAEQDGDRYLLLIRQAVSCADQLLLRREYLPLLPLIELLALQANDAAREAALISSTRYGLEHLAMGEDLLAFILDTVASPESLSRQGVLAMLEAAGPAAVTLTVDKLATTESLAARKALTTMLVQIGAAAVPAILTMMEDKRWFIVRNLAAILGDIRSREAVPGLKSCLQHSDVRVSKEAIRSLAKIGGAEAEAAIITILTGNNPQILPQAMTSLGAMKSRRALVELMRILHEEDLFLNSLPLKLEAVASIAMIADRAVVPHLISLLQSRHLMARSRWQQLKAAVAKALGRLGDSRALPALQKHAEASDELGQACREAIESIERVREAR